MISRSHNLDQQHIPPYFGWRWSFQRELQVSSGSGTVIYVKADGSQDTYELSGTAYVPAREDITAKLEQVGPFTYTLTFKNKTKFTHDVRGNIKTVTDPMNRVSSYDYNGFGQLEKFTNSEGEFWTYSYDGNGYWAASPLRRTPTGPGRPGRSWWTHWGGARRCTTLAGMYGITGMTTAIG
ncbi:MAG: RHS repeat protein [Armatimonadetes bacterium]|nr:RHS repeat protein [Armatimonadota bacterium]